MRHVFLLLLCGSLYAVDEPKKSGAVEESDEDGKITGTTVSDLIRKAPDADKAKVNEVSGKLARQPKTDSDGQPSKRGTIKPDPRDDKAVWDAKLVKPRMESKRPAEVARMAEQLGKPVIWWTYWPDGEFGSDESQEFFASLSDAQHVISGEHESGKGEGPRVIFLHKDGKTRWIAASKVNADTATIVRKHWRGQVNPPEALPWDEPVKGADNRKVAELTVAEKLKVYNLPVGVRGPDGTMRTTTLIEQYRSGQFTDVKAEHCQQHGLSDAQIAFALSLRNEEAAGQSRPQQQAAYGGGYVGPDRLSPSRSAVPQYQPQQFAQPRASAPAFSGGAGVPRRGGG